MYISFKSINFDIYIMILRSTIIVATDFSEIAENAVAYASGLAKATGSKLLLFHAFELSIHSSNAIISSDGMQNELDKTVKRLNNKGNDLSKLYDIAVESFCVYHLPLEDELSILINDNQVELVVMGMAVSSLQQDLMGNTTTSVIKNISIPVLAVPGNALFNNPKKILFASDNKKLSVQRLRWFTRFTEDLKAEVEFFSVEERSGELSLGADKENVEEQSLTFKVVFKSLNSNKVLNEIKKEINNYNADILVMMPQKHGFWDSIVHVSKTRSMAAGLDIPLLSLPNY